MTGRANTRPNVWIVPWTRVERTISRITTATSTAKRTNCLRSQLLRAFPRLSFGTRSVKRTGRGLQPEILQHPSVDAVGGPVDLPAHDPLTVGRRVTAGSLDVAEIPGGAV
jgi:hypothetical protein